MFFPVYSFASACETAMIEAIEGRLEFTIIGYIDGKLHVPSLGMIL